MRGTRLKQGCLIGGRGPGPIFTTYSPAGISERTWQYPAGYSQVLEGLPPGNLVVRMNGPIESILHGGDILHRRSRIASIAFNAGLANQPRHVIELPSGRDMPVLADDKRLTGLGGGREGAGRPSVQEGA